jgi:ADP-ribose pyrophosphatase YjhB (NUDIX family)
MPMDERPVPGVGVILLEGDSVLLVQRSNQPGAGLWAVPGGKVRWGETLADAARREAQEETGLEVEVGPVFWVGESIGDGDPPDWHFVLIDFLASVAGGELQPGSDAAAVRWVRLDEADELPLTPTMRPLLASLREGGSPWAIMKG